ncbi:uncharacterized protein EDB93DRAFT_1105958 [Suillus bovinus]|uniref:uncharacterized protein n=1 Tax=Suillus bovinus TaxID=48563 RepID=UPI001B87FF90|nr:uncharacterized protein EDB93DRAFT_1105958 [Suillus bovinus]KAG2140220.1 hypothetical protein EDB93DRAFT_1105958 [Suillus bovinus]
MPRPSLQRTSVHTTPASNPPRYNKKIEEDRRTSVRTIPASSPSRHNKKMEEDRRTSSPKTKEIEAHDKKTYKIDGKQRTREDSPEGTCPAKKKVLSEEPKSKIPLYGQCQFTQSHDLLVRNLSGTSSMSRCPCLMSSTKKNVAKKRAAGGIARRVSGPIGSPVSDVEEVLQTTEPDLPGADIHSLWCMICHDSAEGDIVLYKCDVCPHIMCSCCINVPASHVGLVQHVDVFFLCLSCHSQRCLRKPAPYIGFYSTGLPEQGGRPVLLHFLRFNGKFETSSYTLMASTPITVIHFILSSKTEVITPIPLLSHYLKYFFPNGGYTYLEVVFDVATHEKINAYTHMQQTILNKIVGGYFQVLSTVFSPRDSLLKAANMVFLMCSSIVAYEDSFVELKQAILNLEVTSAIIFPATRFQPLVATNFLLAMAELVVVEQLDLHNVFPALLFLFNRLGQHSKVILMTRDDSANSPRLLVTTFACAHMQTQPWGIEVPGQCPLCGSTNSWSEKVGVAVLNKSEDANAQDWATVARYIYTCTYIGCGKSQEKPSHRFYMDKPPGVLVNAAKSKTSGWFKSPSTIFPPPPLVQSSPTRNLINFVFKVEHLHTIRNQIVTKHKSLEDSVVLPKGLRKFLTNEDDIRAEEEILGAEQDQDEASGVLPEEREAAARPKDAGFYKKEITDWDVAQKLFKEEINDYDKEEQSKLGEKHSIKFCMRNAREWFKNMTPTQEKEIQDAKEKWDTKGAPAESQAMYQKRNLKKILEDFTEQICCTMGCRVVMLVSHKKISDQTLNVIVYESKAVNSKRLFTQSSKGNKEWMSDGFNKFAEWSKAEFYSDEDTKDKLPELILDQKGYAKLPLRGGINTKGQQELVCWIFHVSYSEVMSAQLVLMGLTGACTEVFTKSAKPVPWREVIAKPSLYLDLNCLPKDFLLRDPSHLRASDINKLWDHWEARCAAKQRLVIFLAAKISDMSKASLKNSVPYKAKKTKEYVEISDENHSDSSAGLPTTPRTDGPAGTKHVSNPSASANSRACTTGAADSDSSDEESAILSFAGCTTASATRPSGAQEGAPAAVAMKDRVRFLKSLSNHDGYLLLVEGINELR